MNPTITSFFGEPWKPFLAITVSLCTLILASSFAFGMLTQGVSLSMFLSTVLYVIYRFSFSTTYQANRDLVLNVFNCPPKIYLMALGLVVADTVALSTLSQLPAATQWGWSSAVFGFSGNISLMPLQTLSVGVGPDFLFLTVVFCVCFVLIMPEIAYLEELTFRHKVTDMRSILIRSVVFGLIHFLAVGISVASTFWLCCVGLIFGLYYRHQYRVAQKSNACGCDSAADHSLALQKVTSFHTLHNTFIVLYLCLFFILV